MAFLTNKAKGEAMSNTQAKHEDIEARIIKDAESALKALQAIRRDISALSGAVNDLCDEAETLLEG